MFSEKVDVCHAGQFFLEQLGIGQRIKLMAVDGNHDDWFTALTVGESMNETF